MSNVLSAVVMFAVLLVFVAFWFYTAIGTDAPPAMIVAGIAIALHRRAVHDIFNTLVVENFTVLFGGEKTGAKR